MDKKAIVLLSGGLDSTTVLAKAKSDGFDVYALSFDYGQRHRVELQAARRVARAFEVHNHEVLELPKATFSGSALTSQVFEVPKDSIGFELSATIPSTYVPARNTVFLSFALGYGEVVGAFDIFIGANAVDYSGYPDCRPEYLRAFEIMANLATKETIEGRAQVKIHAPLLTLSKVEIIELGLSLGVDYSLTHSCYDPDESGRACGGCDSCLLRRRAFEALGLRDPALFLA